MKNDVAGLSKQDEAHHGLKFKLLSNFSWLFAGTAGKIIIRFGASLYLARVLGPLGFGQIAFAQAILAYFILFTDSGLQTFGTREVAAVPEERDRIVGKILTIRFTLIIASMTILLTLAPFLTPSTTTKNLLILFSFVLIPEGANLGWFFRGLEKMMMVGISDILQVSLYFVLILLLVKSHDQILFVPLFYIAGFLLSSLYLLGIYVHQRRLPRICTSIKDNWNYLRSAFPIITVLFFLQIYYNLDILMLGFYRGEMEVGLYNAAYRVIMGIIILSTVLMQSVYPTFSKFYRDQPSEVSKLLKKTLTLSTVFAIPIAIGGTILARSIMVILFGSSFADSKIAFQLLVWSAMLALLAANYGYCLVACLQQKFLAISVGMGTAVNIALNFLLIPGLGILGASLATIIAQGVMLVTQIIFFSRRILPTLPSAVMTLKALGAGLSMGFIIIYLNSYMNFFGLAVIGIVVYFSILWLLGGMPLNKFFSLKRG